MWIGNSIYEYYERISDRYYVAFRIPSKGKTDIKFIWEPLAKKVIVPGYEEFDFFITGEKKDLELHEALTGSTIIRQAELKERKMRRCIQKMFIECLPSEIQRRGGRGNLNQAIVNFICDNNQEISPRYKSIEKSSNEYTNNNR